MGAWSAVAVAVSLALHQSAPTVPQPAPILRGARACDVCPPGRVGTSLRQVTYVNVFYELANLIISGDASRATDKPPDMVPAEISRRASPGQKTWSATSGRSEARSGFAEKP